jgi:hypothetical protein
MPFHNQRADLVQTENAYTCPLQNTLQSDGLALNPNHCIPSRQKLSRIEESIYYGK